MNGPALPPDLVAFIGRRRELAELKQAVGGHRLVTLSGLGGVGKTRLALRGAHELRRRFRDGVAWVELADLRDPSLVAQVIADRLVPSEKTTRDPEAVAVEELRSRHSLLILDNAEHVLVECARLVNVLLREAPDVRMVVTSRQALGVPGERVLTVTPLGVPTAEEATEPGAGVQYESLALFQERASTVVPGFRVDASNQVAVAEICRKLEGIPLAIELAAVKARVLSVAELAARLDSKLDMLSSASPVGSSRHLTLQATIDWSHDLCTPSERLLWARVSVFAGGFAMEAAEECCGDDELPVGDVLEAIAGLVDKSILTRSDHDGRVRFRLLEPLREYGLAALAARDELGVAKRRHAEWCCELLHEASLQWFGPAQERWCVTLRQEKANIRAAAEECLGWDDGGEAALGLLGEPWFLWVALFLDEGRHWLARALAVPGPDSPVRAWALATSGYVAALQGQTKEAEEHLAKSREMARGLGHRACIAYATHILGLNTMFSDPERALPLFQESLSLYESAREVGDDVVVGLRVQYGLALLFVGDVGAAAEQFAVCRKLCWVAGEKWLLSYALFGEGFVNLMRGDAERAVDLAREAITIKRFFGDALGLAVALDLLAWSKASIGAAEEAAILLGASPRRWDTFGVRLFGSDHWLAMSSAAEKACLTRLGRAQYDQLLADGRELTSDDVIAFVQGEGQSPGAPRTPQAAALLTPRENEIADLVAKGLSNKGIAERLVISQRTAECHVENILQKFGFRSRSQIAAWVTEHRTAAG